MREVTEFKVALTSILSVFQVMTFSAAFNRKFKQPHLNLKNYVALFFQSKTSNHSLALKKLRLPVDNIFDDDGDFNVGPVLGNVAVQLLGDDPQGDWSRWQSFQVLKIVINQLKIMLRNLKSLLFASTF